MPAFPDSQVSGSEKNGPKHLGCSGPLPFAEAAKSLMTANFCSQDGLLGTAGGVQIQASNGGLGGPSD
jgi:hypothetical protein